MKIGGLQKLSTIDYPGHLCCVIFLVGCNFRCKFCHNPELVNISEKADNISIDEIMSYLDKRKNILEGVCITGGEPTIHQDLAKLIKPIKKMGYKVKLDTNGTNPQMVKKLIEDKLINYVAMDIKATMDKYEQVVGCSVNIDDIKQTIKILMNNNIDYEFRTTFLPELSSKDIKNIAQFLQGSKKYVVQQFRNNVTLDEEYAHKNPHDSQYIINIAENIKPMFENCEVRGLQ